MTLQEIAARLRELSRRHPDELKVFHSAEEIEELLDFDVVMAGNTDQ